MTGSEAREQFGDDFKGVVENGPNGARAAAAPLRGPAHSAIALEHLGRIATLEQKRYAFVIHGRNLHVQGSSSLTAPNLGNVPTEADIPTIRAALRACGFLEGIDRATIHIERDCDLVLFDLLTGVPLRG